MHKKMLSPQSLLQGLAALIDNPAVAEFAGKEINMPEIKGLKDAPIQLGENDALGLSDYAEALSNFILSADTPMTIGIQGDWGSGKSSMMYLIEEKIQGKNIHTLWFNTWQFSQFNLDNQLSISLLSRFIDNLEKLKSEPSADESVNKPPEDSKLKNTVRKLAFWTVASAAEMAGATKVADKFMDASEESSPVNSQEPSEYIGNLQKDLKELVKNKRKDCNLNRIVVFIDDLDRLLPQKAVEFLESLKLFLDIDGCVYVLACDYQVVTQGLKQKFGVGEAELKGRSFFDKIIQVPFNMPVSQYNVNDFCQKMLEHIEVAHDKEDVNLYVNLISFSVGFNPRTVKRLFNNLLLLKLVLIKKKALEADDVAQVNEKMRILFATLCLQNTFSSLYNYLQNRLKQLGKQENSQIVLSEAEVNTATNELFKKLTDIDTLGQEDGEFAKLWQGVMPEPNAAFFDRLANFMGVFFEAIQLKSDTSENANDTLNAGEIATLKNIMSFSAVVSVDGQQQSTSSEEVRKIRGQNRELIKGVISEIENRYKKELEQLAPIMDKFKIYQPNFGDKELDICAYSNIRSHDKNRISILFWLTDGSREHSTTGEKFIQHYIEEADGDFAKQAWFESNLREIFPDAVFNGKRWDHATFYENKFPPNTSREELENSFRQTAFDVWDKLLPKLLELHEEGKL